MTIFCAKVDFFFFKLSLASGNSGQAGAFVGGSGGEAALVVRANATGVNVVDFSASRSLRILRIKYIIFL